MDSLSQIRTGLRDAHGQVLDFFGSLPEEQLFGHLPGEWAPIDDLRHLTRALVMTERGLRVPKLFLRFRFGRPPRDGWSYDELLAELGREAKERGGRFEAPEKLVPDEKEIEDRSLFRTRRIAGWREAGEGFFDAVERWDERSVDRYCLPHPVLGPLTIREMLRFTHIHLLHHIRVAGKRIRAVEEASVEEA